MNNLAENTEILARSNFNNFANVGPLMKHDGALELWYQEEVIFAHLTGGRNNDKKRLSMCWGQADSII